MNIIKNTKTIGPAVIMLAVLVLALLPLSHTYASGYTPTLITQILLYTILTVAWALFSGTTGYISLAAAAFLGVGIYTAAIAGRTLPLPLMVLLGGLVSAALAALVGAITLRLRGIYFAIFTFGLTALIYQFIRWFEVTITHQLYRQVVVVDVITRYYYMLVIFVLLMLTVYFIRRSRYGLALQSIGQDEDAASHTGINVTVLKIATFAISSFFIGAAGAVLATKITSINPEIAFNFNYSFFPIFMAIIGGMGNIFGPVIGAVVFSYLEEMLMTQFPRYFMLAFGIILIIAIIFLPKGITGLIEKWRRGGTAKSDVTARREKG